MEIYTGEFIQGILQQIPRQNNHEKYLTVYPFTKYHNILFKNQTLHILYKNREHNVLLLESNPSEFDKLKMKLNHLFDIKMN